MNKSPLRTVNSEGMLHGKPRKRSGTHGRGNCARLIFCVGLFALSACSGPGAAERRVSMGTCQDPSTPAATAIAACTAVLDDSAAKRAERVKSLFGRAHARWRSGDLSGALADADALVKLERMLPAAFALRGQIRGMRGDHAAALRDFDRALELHSDVVAYLGDRAVTLAHLGEHERAIEDFGRAIEREPGEWRMHGGRCWSHAVLGKELVGALADCTEAIRLQPTDANLYNSRGFVQFRLGAYAQAVGDYDHAIALAPQTPSSWFMRGQAKARMDDPSSSQDIEQGLAGEPGIAARYAGYGIDW